MKIVDIIEKLALGAFVGCFIVLLVAVLISYNVGPSVMKFSGTDIINAFFGSIVAGWAFSLSGMIYDRDDIALPLRQHLYRGLSLRR